MNSWKYWRVWEHIPSLKNFIIEDKHDLLENIYCRYCCDPDEHFLIVQRPDRIFLLILAVTSRCYISTEFDC